MSVEPRRFSNSDYRRLDALIAEKGWGIYPAHWHHFWLDLERQIQLNGNYVKLENPLILGGSVASLLHKRHRFIGHLLAAESVGLLEWAFEYLSSLSSDSWIYLGHPHPMFPVQKEPILYITGRGGSLDSGYANVLKMRCLDYDGVELNGDFLQLNHQEQVTVIAEILKECREHTVIANSYGAYLLLAVLVETSLSLTNVFLHSPITGSATLEGTYFRPAGSKKLETAIAECNFKGAIRNLFVLVGANDIQCDPERCQLMTAAFQGTAVVLPNQGHQISPKLMDRFTDEFFGTI